MAVTRDARVLTGMPLDPARWERIQDVFHSAADLQLDEQRPFVEKEADGDSDLSAAVMEMLDADARDTNLLDRGIAHAANRVIETGSASDHPLPTENFGAYQIVSVLGEGGMGVVYLAERSDLGSRAAIKILRDAWLSPARRERFAAEQRTLARLTHPSIARLYDSGTLDNGTPWFVMEYVEGTPITEYCHSHNTTIEERLRLFRQVCEAVQYAHSHLVIHRDLKPSNILVESDGTVKLLDFGISKQLDTLDTAGHQTKTAVRMLTPAYASPEQIRGEHAGVPIDIYSLGVILYELLAGKLPFDFDNKSAAEAETIVLERLPDKPSIVAQRSSDPATPADARSASGSTWGDLDVLCLTAMHKDPSRRYRTVDALVRDIDHFLEQQPLEARGDSTSYRLGKFATRNRTALSAGAALFAAVVLLVVFYTVRLTVARNEAVAEAGRAERMQRFTLNLLQGSDEAVGPSESLRVVTLVDRGVQEAKSLDREPAVQAELYETLGSIYMKLGKFEPADSLLGMSLGQRESLFGKNHPFVGQSLVAMGASKNLQAEYDTAEKLVRRGMGILKEKLPLDHPSVAKSISVLGQVLLESGEYDRAIAVLDSGVAVQPDSPNNPELSLTLSDLANAHFYAGHYAISDSLNRKVLAMNRKIYGERHPHVADILVNLGAIQLEFTNLSAAEKHYRDALAIVRPWYGKDHPETGSTATALGRVLVSQKKFDEGVTLLQEAVGIQERVYGPGHPRVASALNELGRAAQQQGRLDEAEADFRRMADIYKTVYKDKHYLIGVALSNLAGVYKDRKQYAESERIFQEVLRRYAVVLEPDHQMVGIAHVRYGETLLAAGQAANAEKQLSSGYRILSKQPTPAATWMTRARNGLATAYYSLGRREDAARMKKEQSQAEKPATVAVTK